MYKKIIGIVIIAVIILAAAMQRPEYEKQEVYIMPGDTLVSIQADICGNHYDYREYLELTMELNPGLTPNIKPGQRIIFAVPKE